MSSLKDCGFYSLSFSKLSRINYWPRITVNYTTTLIVINLRFHHYKELFETKSIVFIVGNGSYLCGSVPGWGVGLLWRVQSSRREDAVRRVPANPNDSGNPKGTLQPRPKGQRLESFHCNYFIPHILYLFTYEKTYWLAREVCILPLLNILYIW